MTVSTHGTVPQHILDELLRHEQPLTVSELVAATGLSKSNVSVALMRLTEAGKVVKPQRGQYLHHANPQARALAVQQRAAARAEQPLHMRYGRNTVRMVECMKAVGRPMAPKEIIAATGLSRSYVNTTLQRLVDRGLVARRAWGVYQAL